MGTRLIRGTNRWGSGQYGQKINRQKKNKCNNQPSKSYINIQPSKCYINIQLSKCDINIQPSKVTRLHKDHRIFFSYQYLLLLPKSEFFLGHIQQPGFDPSLRNRREWVPRVLKAAQVARRMGRSLAELFARARAKPARELPASPQKASRAHPLPPTTQANSIQTPKQEAVWTDKQRENVNLQLCSNMLLKSD